MKTHPFYAVLLMHVTFSLDPYAETAYTDGKSIVFAPDFLDKLSLDETCFILMHEVMHIVLNHCNRKMENMDASLFNAACDIVVNSNILHSFNGDVSKISLKEYGESMHLTPNGKEGCLFTMEEVYRMLEQSKNKQEQGGFDDHSFWENDGDEEEKEQWKQFFAEFTGTTNRCLCSSPNPVERIAAGFNSGRYRGLFLQSAGSEDARNFAHPPRF